MKLQKSVRRVVKNRYSRRFAKLVRSRFFNKMRRENPVAFSELRALEAPYKPHR